MCAASTHETELVGREFLARARLEATIDIIFLLNGFSIMTSIDTARINFQEVSFVATPV